jgi:hypothetical protein
MVLFLAVTAKQKSVEQKIKNYLTTWRQVQQRIPLHEMTELLITPQLPEYPKLAREVFMLLLDGKLRSRTETLKFLKPFAPPPPPPPPPPRRGRAAKAAAETAAVVVPAKAGKKGKGVAVVPAPPAPVPAPGPKTKAPEKAKPAKPEPKSAAKPTPKPALKPAHKPAPKKVKAKKKK